MGAAPEQFDWVKARAACSVLHVFNELRIGVEEDVRRMNSTSVSGESQFAVRANTIGDYFVVFRTDNAGLKVEFNCEMKHITVASGSRNFIVTLTLNNEGRCKLRIDGGDELEQWQVRRMMLEDLFFGPNPA